MKKSFFSAAAAAAIAGLLTLGTGCTREAQNASNPVKQTPQAVVSQEPENTPEIASEITPAAIPETDEMGFEWDGERLADEIAKAKEALYPDPTPDSNLVHLSFFDECYARATAEQREKLDEISEYCDRMPGDCVRKIKQAMGELDEDHPRITLEQARAICREAAASCETEQEAIGEACRRISEIAGACDFHGGSGVNAIYFYLNDEGTECVWCLPCGGISYGNSITGVSEQLLPQE